MAQLKMVRMPSLVQKAAHFSSQILVAVVATGLASTLFGASQTQAPAPKSTEKSALRVVSADQPATRLALYPQDLAAQSNLDNFKPVYAAPPEPIAAPLTPLRLRADDARAENIAKSIVRTRAASATPAIPAPPRRPAFVVKLPDAPAPAAPIAQAPEPQAQPFRIAGVAVPTLDLAKHIPGRETLVQTATYASTAVDWLKHVAID